MIPRLGVTPRTCQQEAECWKRAAAAYITERLTEYFAANPDTNVQLDPHDERRLRVKDQALDATVQHFLFEFCHNTYDFADPSWKVALQLNSRDLNLVVVEVI
jgi:hypothetical protein